MKKNLLLLGAISIIGLSSYSIDTFSVGTQTEVNQSKECKYGQCQKIEGSTGEKSRGKRCKECVSKKGDRYCKKHNGEK